MLEPRAQREQRSFLQGGGTYPNWQESMVVRSMAWALSLVSCVTLACYLASLFLHFYIYKMGIKLVLTP